MQGFRSLCHVLEQSALLPVQYRGYIWKSLDGKVAEQFTTGLVVQLHDDFSIAFPYGEFDVRIDRAQRVVHQPCPGPRRGHVDRRRRAARGSRSFPGLRRGLGGRVMRDGRCRSAQVHFAGIVCCCASHDFHECLRTIGTPRWIVDVFSGKCKVTIKLKLRVHNSYGFRVKRCHVDG